LIPPPKNMTALPWRIKSDPIAFVQSFESTATGSGTGGYDSPPLPSLALTLAGADLQLNWPLTASGFVLEQTVSLGDPAAWSEVGGAYAPAPDGFSVMISRPGPSGFYRLIKP
jgi:hypothetical protein